MLKNTILFCLISGSTLLAGCSGHPSAGKWVSVDNDTARYTRISVDFDGKAAIYPADKNIPVRNCYWQASSAEKVDIQCGTENKDEGFLLYTLEVGDDQNLATLTFEKQPAGQFKRLP